MSKKVQYLDQRDAFVIEEEIAIRNQRLRRTIESMSIETIIEFQKKLGDKHDRLYAKAKLDKSGESYLLFFEIDAAIAKFEELAFPVLQRLLQEQQQSQERN